MFTEVYTIENEFIRISVIPLGATVISVFDKTFQREMTLNFDDIEKYRTSDKYFGCTIGRVANRIAQGSFVLDQQVFQLALNQKPHHLHGGLKGFDKKIFICETIGNQIRCTYQSRHLEEGYPGNLEVEISYILEDNRFLIETISKTDQKTLVNLTNHTYFNLDEDKQSILDHDLQVYADTVYPIDSLGCTFDQPFDVNLTPFDFRNTKKIRSAIENDHPQIVAGRGIDHHFVKSNSGLRIIATLSNSDTALNIYTDKPGTHIYTGNYLDGTDLGVTQQPYNKHSGICFETQYVPNSINFNESIAPILSENQVQRHKTIYEFIHQKR